ncbi:iron uptake transporter deferrochelatase/peroxidase subunit [Falsirhodobacter sp. alg1]|uniref:iron uptake transporter deferrochelatase/peroxidase subunit n=1 Tax=Falsirhodobacter sp. alg1 TaxID=1472418 RepID=UPI0007883696|nr:iron uptake transporter deferrochelatase/peroxidase subunit [Falsirhodobacter sp. alg1]
MNLPRRHLMIGLAGLAGTAATYARAETPLTSDAPKGHVDTAVQRVPFYGPHQAGVTTPRPEAGIMAAFDVVVRDVDGLEDMLRRLTERGATLTAGGPVPERDPNLPPADSGILGDNITPDNLTMTVSLGASLFDKLEGLDRLRPRQLQRMVEFPNDALVPANCHGDLSIQFSANLPDTAMHALRDIVKNMSDALVLRWMQEGNVPPVLPAADGTTPSARNFLGFRDGSANPDSNDADLMRNVVWVQDGAEPAWATGGTYQVVRVIRNFVERWDRARLSEQEAIIGRRKMSGAPLDQPDANEHTVPDYTAGDHTPMDAHIRMANPRGPDADKHLILRRPFNYSNGIASNGQLDQGLLFICYQADMELGFLTVQNRLNGEPLEEYIKPVGGGYFFTLPGVANAGDYLGSALIMAARQS